MNADSASNTAKLPANGMSAIGLSVKGLALAAGEKQLARNLDFAVAPGESMRVVGPNGAGKSTLLAVLAGLAPYQHGQIQLGGEELRSLKISRLSTLVSLLRQAQLFAYPYSVEEVFASHGQDIDDAIGLSMRVPELSEKRLTQLSGGELQRVFLSLTLMRNTWLTLLDEPLASQDDEMKEVVTSLLRELMLQGRSFLVATHTGFEEIPALSLSGG